MESMESEQLWWCKGPEGWRKAAGGAGICREKVSIVRTDAWMTLGVSVVRAACPTHTRGTKSVPYATEAESPRPLECAR